MHLDTFGFSRGAAAARNCIHQAITKGLLKQRLNAAGKPPGSVKCKFVGLFDTVASYGVAHYNDTSDLNLNCLREADRVVQLAAADEHRANFRLTNIRSAGGSGEEHFLPGVHSDVGGGYNDGASENILLLNIPLVAPRVGVIESNVKLYERELKWFTSSGWYQPSQLTCHKGANGTIRGVRTGISSAYSLIPLEIMGEFSRQNGVPISNDLQDYHAVPENDPILSTARAEIKARVNGRTDSSPGVWFKDDPLRDPAWLKSLRNKYFHFSATNSVGMGPERQNGYRRRVIQDG